MTTFAERLALAEQWEAEVADKLRAYGWEVEQYGQALYSRRVQMMLKRESNATDRWRPDLIACRKYVTVYVDAKTRQSESANHSIEKSSLSAMVSHDQAGSIPVYLVFSNWSCIRVLDLWERTDTKDCWAGAPSKNGSGTPYWVIPKRSIRQNLESVFS